MSDFINWLLSELSDIETELERDRLRRLAKQDQLEARLRDYVERQTNAD